MALPFFYINNYTAETELTLDEDTSRHVVQVLRMKEGGQLNLTDGNGILLTCGIVEANKKHCVVRVRETKNYKPQTRNVSVAISLLKNSNRFEWFLEKATEIGVNEIIPLLCERTEREKFRHDRMNAICISAMLQSQQCWLPILHEPADFSKAIASATAEQKFIAHCEEGDKQPMNHFQILKSSNCQICIGPEGDFTPGEIELALQNGFQPVSLGTTRLRSETAGIVAVALLQAK